MISVDIDAATILRAAELLVKKNDICEVAPKVRISIYEKHYSDSIELVCTHKDPNLNCGVGGEYCNSCKNKEKVYEEGRKFNKLLGTSFQRLMQRLEKKENL